MKRINDLNDMWKLSCTPCEADWIQVKFADTPSATAGCWLQV